MKKTWFERNENLIAFVLGTILGVLVMLGVVLAIFNPK